jgi:hypothetical protein
MPDDFARTLFMASRPYLILNVLPAGLTRPGAQTIRTHLIELIGPAPRVAEGGVVETDDAQWVGPHVGKTTRQEDMLHALGVGVLVAVGTMVGVLVGVATGVGVRGAVATTVGVDVGRGVEPPALCDQMAKSFATKRTRIPSSARNRS